MDIMYMTLTNKNIDWKTLKCINEEEEASPKMTRFSCKKKGYGHQANAMTIV